MQEQLGGGEMSRRWRAPLSTDEVTTAAWMQRSSTVRLVRASTDARAASLLVGESLRTAIAAGAFVSVPPNKPRTGLVRTEVAVLALRMAPPQLA